MNIKENIQNLFNLNLSNYKISKETGIAQTTLGRFTRRESEIGNMTLDNALKLNNYYNKLKGEIKMRKIYETINHNFITDGQDKGKYATYYVSKENIVDEYFGDTEIFFEKYDTNPQKKLDLDKLNYPIITFDQQATSGGELFESTATREDIMSEAYDYFKLDNNVEGIWYFEDYTVYEESDLLRFEDLEGKVLGHVSNHEGELQEDLNYGVDPIEDGWEDGTGNTVNIEGWSQE